MLRSSLARCVKRVFVFIFAWGLLMIATMQFRHLKNKALWDSVPTAEENIDNLAKITDGTGNERGASRSSDLALIHNLLQRSLGESDGAANSAGNGIFSTTLTTIRNHLEATKSSLEMEPLLDKIPAKTEQQLIEEIAEKIPSLPLSEWIKNERLTQKNGNKNCSRYPQIYDLEFNNIYWQTLRTSNGTFQFFGAFYDNRRLSTIGPVVRIIGMIDRIKPTVKTYCQLWYEGEREPRIVKMLEYTYIWYAKWGNYKQGMYQPYMITCRVPPQASGRPPSSVSMVEKRCDTANNNLRVIYNKPEQKKDFAVCVKGLDFLHEDLSVRLIEWIELISLLGADKIYFYELQVHPNVTKVLQHYQSLNMIHVTPLTLPGGQPNVPAFQHMYLTKKIHHKRQNELIPYNDCLYKHMYEYEYIALLDIDEIIMPMKDATWQDLMRRVLPKALKIRNETSASYNVRNVYFLDDLLHSHGYFKGIPKYLHMLQHVYRSKNFTKPNHYIKCFHNPERVLTLHNHFPLACLGAGCTKYSIETEDAQLQHYRADCVKSLKNICGQYRNSSIVDTTIWRYKDKLIDKVISTLKTLGFFGPR